MYVGQCTRFYSVVSGGGGEGGGEGVEVGLTDTMTRLDRLRWYVLQ